MPGSAALVTFWKGWARVLIEWRLLELLRISPATDEVSGEPVVVGKPLPAGYGSDPGYGYSTTGGTCCSIW